MTTTENTTTAHIVRITDADGTATYEPLDHVAMTLARSTDLTASFVVGTLRNDGPQQWGGRTYAYMEAEVPAEAVEDYTGQMLAEVMAQLDDLSDDTMDTLRKYEIDGDGDDASVDEAAIRFAALLAVAEDLRLTLQQTIDQRVDDWRADNGL